MRPVGGSQPRPHVDWRYLSTSAQLRGLLNEGLIGDITPAVGQISPARLERVAELAHAVGEGARCFFCGATYAPAGPVLVARVLDHLSRECPEIVRRTDELTERADALAGGV